MGGAFRNGAAVVLVAGAFMVASTVQAQSCDTIPTGVYFPRGARFVNDGQRWSYACITSRNYAQQCPPESRARAVVATTCARAVDENLKILVSGAVQARGVAVAHDAQLWDEASWGPRPNAFGNPQQMGTQPPMTLAADIARLEALGVPGQEALLARAHQALNDVNQSKQRIQQEHAAAADCQVDPEDRDRLALYRSDPRVYAGVRQTAMNELRNDIRAIFSRSSADGGMHFSVQDYRQAVPAMKRLIARAHCFDPGTAAQWEVQAQPWIAKAEHIISDAESEDAKCDADPRCKGQRIAAQLCPAVDRRAEVNDAIEDNNRLAKKTGVINLQEQYDLGEELRDLDAQIANLTESYRVAAHKAFHKSVCKNLQ